MSIPKLTGGKPVLVVDDDDDMRAIMRELLETSGFAVMEARNGKQALELMTLNREPALVILDVEMPVMSGTELVESMRSHEHLARVPVLILSGSRKLKVKPLMPVVGIFSKPFDADQLIITVKAWATPSPQAHASVR